MSAWLARFEASEPALEAVPNVPIVPKLPPEPTFGTFDTIGTRPEESAAGLSDWAAKLLAMHPDDEPCPGIRRWHAVHRAVRQFLQLHEADAVRLGWSTLDLFAVHRRVGTIRGDCTGALLLGSDPVSDITADTIRYRDGLAYRRRPMSAAECVPVWEFGL